MGVLPPLVGVAVKFVLVPAQIVDAEATTDTEGVTLEFTVIVTPLELTGLGEAQLAFDIK
jgi:hypothetical protein